MKKVRETTIFGVKVGLDPKLLLGALVTSAALLFWYNFTAETEGVGIASPSSSRQADTTASNTKKSPGPLADSRRKQHSNNDRTALRLIAVDATSGNLDPTIRTDLLSKVAAVDDELGKRNLFEISTPPASLEKIKGPTIIPQPLLATSAVSRATSIPMQASIPLKYYGYVSAPGGVQVSAGVFLDGDHVLIAAKGESVKGRYLVLELTPLIARLEDTQLKLDQVLAVAEP